MPSDRRVPGRDLLVFKCPRCGGEVRARISPMCPFCGATMMRSSGREAALLRIMADAEAHAETEADTESGTDAGGRDGT
jgi:predicted RNA-binding Zn-ribbon protein involved in translation (DUF1610 family)